MPQYTMHSEYSTYVAMDVHSRSVTIAALDLATGEGRSTRLAGPPRAADAVAWCSGWATGPLYFAFESGPCGFQLKRDLESMGCACDVIAVSSIPRNADDRGRKDDRRDARRLLSEITKIDSKVRPVYMPTPRVEALRDLVRARDDAARALKRAKQQASGMLTRYGHVWDERTPAGGRAAAWTAGYVAWARSAEFADPLAKATLDRCLEAVEECRLRLRGLDDACREQAREGDCKPYVDALTRLIGVGEYAALVFYSSMGDFERFRNGRSVSSYYGLTPGRRDSGERAGGPKGITKAGDALCRRVLLEGLCGSVQSARRNAKAMRRGQQVSAAVEAEARKCNARRRARYAHLVGRGKHPNVARAAVASECAIDMWVIGRMVQRELRGE